MRTAGERAPGGVKPPGGESGTVDGDTGGPAPRRETQG